MLTIILTVASSKSFST